MRSLIVVPRPENAHPSALVLVCRLYGDTKLASGRHDKIWVPQELAGEKNNVRAVLLDDLVGLLRLKYHPNSAGKHFRVRTLDIFREGHLFAAVCQRKGRCERSANQT